MQEYLPPLSPRAQRWVRFFALLAAVVGIVWLGRALSGVLTPLAAALAIAYIFNPVVTWLEQRCGIRRFMSVLIGMFFLVGLGLVLLFAGTLQVYQLANNLPRYLTSLQEWAATSLPMLMPDDQTKLRVKELLQQHGGAVATTAASYVGAWLSNTFYLISLLVLLPMYTFFCLWHFNHVVKVVHDHLPEQSRATIVRIGTTIDRAISDFFRGRLVVSMIVGILAAIGWSIVGVKYSIALGALAGALNLIPFMSVVALPPAILVAWMGATEAGQSWFHPVLFTIGVYFTVQAIESFVLSPIVDARSTGLHPVTTIVALLIGAELMGILGMLLAIPIASTLKSLLAEFVFPEVRRLAGRPDPPPTDPPAAKPDAGPATPPAKAT